MRDDLAEARRRYANPETELKVASVVIVLGIICLIVSFGDSINHWMIIAITLLVIGVLMALVGIWWYYSQSQSGQRETNARSALSEIAEEKAECDSMLSNNSPRASPRASPARSPACLSVRSAVDNHFDFATSQQQQEDTIIINVQEHP